MTILIKNIQFRMLWKPLN